MEPPSASHHCQNCCSLEFCCCCVTLWLVSSPAFWLLLDSHRTSLKIYWFFRCHLFIQLFNIKLSSRDFLALTLSVLKSFTVVSLFQTGNVASRPSLTCNKPASVEKRRKNSDTLFSFFFYHQWALTICNLSHYNKERQGWHIISLNNAPWVFITVHHYCLNAL